MAIDPMAPPTAEDVSRAREYVRKLAGTGPLECIWCGVIHSAYCDKEDQIARDMAAYSAAENARLTQELLERTTQRNLAREARENWRKRAEAAEKLQALTLQNEIRWMKKSEAAESERDTLRRAASEVLQAFEDGVFVRATCFDGRPYWAIKLMKPLQSLATLKTLAGAALKGESAGG